MAELTNTLQHNALHGHRAIHLALIGIQEPPSDQGDKHIHYNTMRQDIYIYIFFYWLRSDSSSKTRLRISVGRSLGVGYLSSRFIPDKYLSLNSMSTTTTTTTTLNRTTLNPTFFSFCFLFLFTLIEHNKRIGNTRSDSLLISENVLYLIVHTRPALSALDGT